MNTTNPTNKAVACPIHGTHGNLSNGLCWFCVQTGNKSAVAGSSRVITFNDSVSPIPSRAPGTVRIIT